MTFYKYILLFLFAVVFFINVNGQVKPEKNFALSEIKSVFRRINNYKKYEIVTINDCEDFLGHATDNGGSLKGYFKGDSLKKIVEWVGLSNRVLQREYYFDKGKLVFVYSTESRYGFNDSTESFDYSKLKKVFEGRYYFSKDRLIDTILNDKQHEKTKKKDAAEFLVSGSSYLKLLNSRRK